jgi:hypothetical protein
MAPTDSLSDSVVSEGGVAESDAASHPLLDRKAAVHGDGMALCK